MWASVDFAITGQGHGCAIEQFVPCGGGGVAIRGERRIRGGHVGGVERDADRESEWLLRRCIERPHDRTAGEAFVVGHGCACFDRHLPRLVDDHRWCRAGRERRGAQRLRRRDRDHALDGVDTEHVAFAGD
jgi:hypothetical protein